MNKDKLIGIILIIFSLAGVAYSATIPSTSNLPLAATTKFYPIILLIALGFCGFVIMLTAPKCPETAPSPKFSRKKLAIYTGLLILYIVLFKYIGFIVSTVIFMLLAMRFHGEKRPLFLIGFPVLSGLGMYLLFCYLFQVPLP